jgi:hypothetical protein
MKNSYHIIHIVDFYQLLLTVVDKNQQMQQVNFALRLHKIKPQNSSYVSRLLYSILSSEARISWVDMGDYVHANHILDLLEQISKLDLDGTIDKSIDALKVLTFNFKTLLIDIIQNFKLTIVEEEEEMVVQVLDDIQLALSHQQY